MKLADAFPTYVRPRRAFAQLVLASHFVSVDFGPRIRCSSFLLNLKEFVRLMLDLAEFASAYFGHRRLAFS